MLEKYGDFYLIKYQESPHYILKDHKIEAGFSTILYFKFLRRIIERAIDRSYHVCVTMIKITCPFFT